MGKKRNNGQYQSKSNLNVKRTNNKNPLGVAFFVVPLIVLVFMYAFIFAIMEDGVYFYISPVFKNYQPLEKTSDKEMENYFVDECGLFYDEERYYLINDSADYFYEKTGVRVFLYAVPAEEKGKGNLILPSDEEANKTCRDVCNELSAEGIDLVLLYIPTPTGFETWTYATDEVRQVYGNKCEKIIEQYLVHNFHVVGEHDELFYYSYRSAADRISGGFTSPLSLIKENLRIVILAVITIAVFGGSVVFYVLVGKRA